MNSTLVKFVVMHWFDLLRVGEQAVRWEKDSFLRSVHREQKGATELGGLHREDGSAHYAESIGAEGRNL